MRASAGELIIRSKIKYFLHPNLHKYRQPVLVRLAIFLLFCQVFAFVRPLICPEPKAAGFWIVYTKIFAFVGVISDKENQKLTVEDNSNSGIKVKKVLSVSLLYKVH